MHKTLCVTINDSRIRSGGLIRAVAESWFPSHPDEPGLLLEDDIEVSPLFYAWIHHAMAAYHGTALGFRDRVAGISLYTPRMNEVNIKKKYLFDPSRLMEALTNDPTMPYLHQLPCSWGAVYFGRHWGKFLEYMTARLDQEERHSSVDPRTLAVKPPHSTTPGWQASWKKYMIETMYIEDWYILYPSFPNQTSFSTNHLEAGVHIGVDHDSNHAAQYYTVPLFRHGDFNLTGETGRNDESAPRLHVPLLDTVPKLDLLGNPMVTLDYLSSLQQANNVHNNVTKYHYWSVESGTLETAIVNSSRKSGPTNLFWRRNRQAVCRDYNAETNKILSKTNHGMITVMISTFDRFDILQKQLDHYTRSPRVSLVLVTWNDLTFPVPPPMHVNHVLVEFIPQSTDSLNNRFLPSMRVISEAVLILDDDMWVHLDDIELLYKVWEANMDHIVGFCPRRVEGDKYNLNGADRWNGPYHLMLTKVMMLHKDFLEAYSCGPSMGPVHKMVDEAMNCEDISMNFVVSNMTNKSAPLFVEPLHFVGDFGDSRFTKRDGVKGAIHQTGKTKSGAFKDMNHVEARSHCIRTLAKHFGFNNGLPSQSARIATVVHLANKTAEAFVVPVSTDTTNKVGCVETYTATCGLDGDVSLRKWTRILPEIITALKLSSAEAACSLSMDEESHDVSIIATNLTCSTLTLMTPGQKILDNKAITYTTGTLDEDKLPERSHFLRSLQMSFPPTPAPVLAPSPAPVMAPTLAPVVLNNKKKNNKNKNKNNQNKNNKNKNKNRNANKNKKNKNE